MLADIRATLQRRPSCALEAYESLVQGIYWNKRMAEDANRAFFTCADLQAGAELQQGVYLEVGYTVKMDQAAVHSFSRMRQCVKCP